MNGTFQNGLVTNDVNSSGKNMQTIFIDPITKQVNLSASPTLLNNPIPMTVNTVPAQPNSIQGVANNNPIVAQSIPNNPFPNQMNLTPVDIQRIINMNNLNNGKF